MFLGPRQHDLSHCVAGRTQSEDLLMGGSEISLVRILVETLHVTDFTIYVFGCVVNANVAV